MDNFVANSKAFVDLLRIIVVDGTMVGGPTSSEVGVVDKVGGTLLARRMGEGLSSTREVTQFARHPTVWQSLVRLWACLLRGLRGRF